MFEVLIEFKGGAADAKEYRTRDEALDAFEAAKRRFAARYVALYKRGSLIASWGR